MHRSTAFVAIAALIALALIGFLADRQSAAQGPAALRPVPRWEYKTIRASLTAEEAGQSELNPLGEEGWELVLCHNLILGYTDFSLQRASSILICQSTPR